MGTRHLIAVQIDGEYKIAQYGQWDGYPKGQGSTVLEFLASMDRKTFEERLRLCRWATQEDFDEIERRTAETPSLQWQKEWPHLSRDAGADILSMVQSSPSGLALRNSLNFAGDSLFCEWAYVLDMDRSVLEVYKGFNQVNLTPADRFFNVTNDEANKDYNPIRKVAEWPFDKLPTVDEMAAQCCR